MTLSFRPIDRTFWAAADSHALFMLDLQEVFNHIFSGHYQTTESFLRWLPSSYGADLELCEAAAHKLSMLTAPITYCNEDCDRKSTICTWAMTSVPAKFWVDFRNEEACKRLDAERLAEKAAV